MNPEFWLNLFSKLLPTFCKIGQLLLRRKPVLPPPSALIVEDNEHDAELLARLLRKSGFVVECAASAEIAEALVAHAFYDVLLVDMRLPKMSGARFLQIVSERCPNSKRVAVTGHSGFIVETGFYSGFIRKPVNLEAVQDMIQQLGL